MLLLAQATSMILDGFIPWWLFLRSERRDVKAKNLHIFEGVNVYDKVQELPSKHISAFSSRGQWLDMKQLLT